MDKLSDYLSKSRSNYLNAREESLDLEILKDTRLDYFRTLLLKKTSFNPVEFKQWCTKNNYLDLYELAMNDVKYLKDKNILSIENEIYKFKSEKTFNRLFKFQTRFIDKNEYRINLLSQVKNDEYFNLLTKELQVRFKEEVLSSSNKVLEYLNFVGQNPTNSFGNTTVIFLQLLEKNISFNMLREHSYWLNQSVSGKTIEIIDKSNDIKILKPITQDNKVLSYSVKKLYDISQTNITPDEILSKKVDNIEDIKNRLENAIKSSPAISKIFSSSFFSLELSAVDKINHYCKKLANYYFFDSDEKEMFLYLIKSALNLENETIEFNLDNIRHKLSNVISTFNIISTELLLNDLINENSLEDLFYFKLGKKSSILKENDFTFEDDKELYQFGNVNFDKMDFNSSFDLAKEVLDNEELKIEINYENLFLSTKKLTILSGAYTNQSFTLDSDYNDDELKVIIARDFLSKIIEKQLIKDIINTKGKENEPRREQQLFSREYQNNSGQLHDGVSEREVSENGRGQNLNNLSVQDSRTSNGPIEQSDSSGIQRERSVGDSEQGIDLSIIKLIPEEYRTLLSTAEYSTFKHTQTENILDTMKLNKNLSKSDYIAFNKFLSKHDIGYYSRIAKAFIIKNKDVLSYFKSQSEQSDTIISSNGFKINEIVKFKNETLKYLGKNIFDGDVFVDQDKIRKYSNKDDATVVSDKFLVEPGINTSSEHSKFIKGEFEFLTLEEVKFYLQDTKNLDKLTPKGKELLESKALLTPKFGKSVDEIDVDEYDAFLKENYPKMSTLDKNKYQDIIDSRIQARAETLANHFGFGLQRVNEWLEVAKFRKSRNDTNVISMTVFGIEDQFKDINEYASEIVESQEYKSWYAVQNKDNDNDVEKSLNGIEDVDFVDDNSYSCLIRYDHSNGDIFEEKEHITKAELLKYIGNRDVRIFTEDLGIEDEEKLVKSLYYNNHRIDNHYAVHIDPVNETYTVLFNNKYAGEGKVKRNLDTKDDFKALLNDFRKENNIKDVEYYQKLISNSNDIMELINIKEELRRGSVKKLFNEAHLDMVDLIQVADKKQELLRQVNGLNDFYLRKHNLEIVGVDEYKIWNFEEQEDLKSFESLEELSNYVTSGKFKELIEDSKELLSKDELESKFKEHDSRLEVFAEHNGTYSLLLKQNIVLSVVIKEATSLENLNEFYKNFNMANYDSERGYYDENQHIVIEKNKVEQNNSSTIIVEFNLVAQAKDMEEADEVFGNSLVDNATIRLNGDVSSIGNGIYSESASVILSEKCTDIEQEIRGMLKEQNISINDIEVQNLEKAYADEQEVRINKELEDTTTGRYVEAESVVDEIESFALGLKENYKNENGIKYTSDDIYRTNRVDDPTFYTYDLELKDGKKIGFFQGSYENSDSEEYTLYQDQEDLKFGSLELFIKALNGDEEVNANYLDSKKIESQKDINKFIENFEAKNGYYYQNTKKLLKKNFNWENNKDNPILYQKENIFLLVSENFIKIGYQNNDTYVFEPIENYTINTKDNFLSSIDIVNKIENNFNKINKRDGLHFINLEYETGLDWDDITSEIPTLTIDSGVHNDGNITKVSLTLNTNETFNLFYDEISNEYTFVNENDTNVEILNKVGYLLQNKIDLELLSDKILNNKIDILDKNNINEIINGYIDISFENDTYRIFPDTSIAEIYDNKIVDVLIDQLLAKRILAAANIENKIKYSELTNLPIGLTQANYTERIRSFEKQKSDMENGNLSVNEHTFKSLYDKLQYILDYEEKNNIISERSLNEINKFNNNNKSHSKISERESNQLGNEPNRDIGSTELRDLSSSDEIGNSESGSSFNNGDIVNERNENLTRDWKFELNNDELKVLNLKDFYSVNEIENLFIKKQVTWEIFANKYIFDLTNEVHLDLIKNELNLELPYSSSSEDSFLEYKKLIKETTNKKDLTDLYYKTKKEFTDKDLTESESSELYNLIDTRFLEIDEEIKDTHYKSICKLRSQGNTHYKQLLKDYNSKYDVNISEEDIQIDKETFEKYKQISLKTLTGIYNRNEKIDDELSKHNEIFNDKITLDDLEDDFSISESQSGGTKTKFKNYLAGIEIIRKIEKDEEITLEEKNILSKMPGIGTIAQAFPRTDGTVSKGWENEAEELKAALTDEEYQQAARATLDAYYTDEAICKAMWKAIENFGYSGGSVVEPSVGIGNFFGYMPKHLKPNSQLIGIELDKTTSKVVQTLYPKSKIYNIGFQNFKLLEGQKASLVIGNPPYGSHKIYDKTIPELNGISVHNYFMGKSIDCLENGGVMAMVVSNNFLDSNDPSTRAFIGKTANLIGAIRLPKGSFGNANTEIVTDIVFFQKRDYGMESNIHEWLNISEINDTPINEYFVKNQENLLGEWGKFGTMYRGDEPGLIANPGQDTNKLLFEAIENLPKYINFQSGRKSYSKYPISESSISSSEKIMQFKTNNLANIMAKQNGEKMSSNARVNSFFINDEKIYKRLPDLNGEIVLEEINTKVNSKNEEVPLSDLEIERIKGMIKIAEIASKLRASQLDESISDGELEILRKELNNEYDSFVKKYGYLNKGVNARLFEDDVNGPFLLALEKKYDKGISSSVAKKFGVKPIKESATKADIFFRRTQTPYKMPTTAESYEDALHISLGEKAYVDMSYMSKLLNKDITDIENYLSSNGFIFNDPNYGWVTKEEYLSGNVKEKYKQTDNPKNLEALEQVIPEDIPAIDIAVACGASWIPREDINDFLKIMTGDDEPNAYYVKYTASWSVADLTVASDKENTYGTGRRRAKDIILAALNNKQVTVYDKIEEDGKERNVINQDETTAANDKVDLVKEAWNEWIWDTSDRRERLAKLYNEKFNVYARRTYDGSHLKFPGKVDDNTIELRPHQKNAVWRILQNGRDLFDHTVGSGKTFSAIASVMELKRTGKSKKPLVVVPNHLVSQWAKEWLELYPNANILVPTKKDFTARKRKLLMSRIATGEYDAIIIAHSQLIKIENDKDYEVKFLEDQISQIHEAINQMRREKGENGLSIKQWQKRKDALKSKIESLLDNSKDDNLNFSELGIDAMVVDEAHEFKNLQFHTSLQQIRGLGNPQGSQKAFDMFIKTQCLLEKTNNKNLIFLTGTPISNSIAELYTLKRYLMMDELKRDGLEHFDAWAKQYADIKTDWELTASGKYKLVTRMSKFKNMPELIASYRTFADVVTTQMVKDQLALEGKVLDIPAVKNGKPNNIIVERSEDQANFIGVPDENGIYKSGTLVYRSENMPKGKPKKGDDNMLVVMSDAKKASLDMRLIDSTRFDDFEGSKVNYCINDLIANYHEWEVLKGTQLIFCDLSTPKGSSSSERLRIEELVKRAEEGDDEAANELEKLSPDELDAINSVFSVYDDVKEKLIKRGIPEKEIAFIHDAKTDLQKQELFLKVNSGQIRFLMGSTSKMGAGMNVQKRLVNLGHLDVPWRPSDLEQREGRIIRQGNLIFKLFKEIKLNDYDLKKINKDRNCKDIIKELNLSSEHLDEIINKAKEVDGVFDVTINRYATKNTLDSGLWEKIEAKARFIQQLKNGEVLEREVEDISGEEANAAEMKAASSGNPLILEEMQLKTEINKLEAVKKNFKRSLHDREERIKYYEKSLDTFDEEQSKYLGDISKYDKYKAAIEIKKAEFEKKKQDNKNKGISNKDLKPVTDFEFIINDKVYDKREEVGAYIIKRARDLQYETKVDVKSVDVGTIADFEVSIEKASLFRETLMRLVISGENDYIIDFDSREQKAIGIAVKMVNELDRIKTNYQSFLNHHSSVLKELPKLKELPTDFPKEDELQLIKKRYKVVINELKSEEKKTTQDTNKNSKVSSIQNDWVDENKDLATTVLLVKGNFDLSVIEKIDYEIIENCLVLNNQLDRNDYLKFQKIFESFGGIWDRKKSAIVFSDDGMNRIKDVLLCTKECNNILTSDEVNELLKEKEVVQDYA